MAISTDLEILNRVLRELSSSFLQYVGECWPWTAVGPNGKQLRTDANQCVGRQRKSIEMIAEYLAPRQARVEFGKFSTVFTDLHFVSLQFLLKQLIGDQTRLVESVDRSVTLLLSGDPSRDILEAVSRNEHDNLSALQQLSAK
jgi:hypothetical protein